MKFYTNKHPEPQRLKNAVTLAYGMLADHPHCSERQIDDACRGAVGIVETSYYGVGDVTVGQVKELLITKHFTEKL